MVQSVIANDLERYRKDVDRYETILQSIRSDASSIFEEMKSLGTMWEGNAHSVLMQQFQADAVFTEEVIQILEKLQEELQEAGGRYTACEAEAADRIRELTV